MVPGHSINRNLAADQVEEESNSCVNGLLQHAEFGDWFANAGEEVGGWSEGVEQVHSMIFKLIL